VRAVLFADDATKVTALYRTYEMGALSELAERYEQFLVDNGGHFLVGDHVRSRIANVSRRRALPVDVGRHSTGDLHRALRDAVSARLRAHAAAAQVARRRLRVGRHSTVCGEQDRARIVIVFYHARPTSLSAFRKQSRARIGIQNFGIFGFTHT